MDNRTTCPKLYLDENSYNNYSMLDISRATLYQRLKDAGISSDDRSHLSDVELDDLIRSLNKDHLNDGEVLIQGHLVRMKIRVPRQALRQSIHRVDHACVVV